MSSKRIPMIAVRVAALALASPWALHLNGQADITLAAPVTVVRADPHHRGTLLAGTATALLYRSRNGADSWIRLPFPAELRSNLHALMIDPVRTDVYLVAVTSEIPRYAGLYRSTDEGATWEQLRDLRQKQAWSLASWTGDSHVIAAGTEDGIFITRDGGDNWTNISARGYARPQPVVTLAFDPAHRNILYAGTPHLAWKTTDDGRTWHALQRGMPEDSDIFSIIVDGKRSTRLFAGACSGIYRSLNGGETWASLEQAVGAQFRTYVVAHAPHSANVLFVGTNGGLLQSPDGGATWRHVSRPTTRSVAFDPVDPRHVFVATDEGILRSEDGGGHFAVANQGLYDRSSAFPFERSDYGPPGSSICASIRTKQ
jgi:photosystem II stability/assembly factor-like uncharacterized protein